MKAHAVSYAWFLAFVVVTKIVVAPIAKNLNIPILSDALA